MDTCEPTGEVCAEAAERNLASYLRAVGGGMMDVG
jgi:hypothetical protein